jgi:subtilisin family serine protease
MANGAMLCRAKQPQTSGNSMTTNPDSTSTFTSSRRRRVFFYSLFFVAAGIAAVGAIGSPRGVGQPERIDGSPSPQARSTGRVADNAFHLKIAPWVLEHTVNGQPAEFFVVLADQADLSGAAAFATKAEKGRYVHETLLNKAQTTQEPILQWLRARAIEHRPFYILNTILVKGTREIAEALAIRPDVARIEGNPQIHNALPQGGPVSIGRSQPGAPATIERGIAYTHAPDVWALGFTGQGIVVASADTGVRWTHNALKPHYRGWDGQNANHNYNWHDSIHDSVGNPCGNDSQQPCDDFFHGSHTTGTAIGDDGMGNQIGMAPGAKWIGCRNMDHGTGTPARYIECMEFFLAPYPLNCTPNEGDPTKAPDITINSWVCPPSEGCSANTLQAAVEAQAAAGIMMVVAAGNAGPSCSTVHNPPSLYAASYTVGALILGTDTIASFSGRGPVTIDGSNRIKPDITAPGTNTRSCDNSCDSCYRFASGTSMATPHISGAMALLWSALPSFQHQITSSRDALNNAAVHIADTTCGTAGPPNNTYGWGRVDIATAVGTPSPTATPSPTPTATGTPSACPQGTATPTPTPTPTVQVSVQTNPAGLAFSVDGTTYTSTQTFTWVSGSSHTIAITSPQSGGTGVRFAWTRWSDNGAISHTVAPTTNTTYTATFRTQYYLTMTHGTGGTVSPASGWKNGGTEISITATPTNNAQVSYRFDAWTGSGTGSYSGTNNPASITMNGPITENATFIQNPVQITAQTNPAGRSFSVDGTTYTSAQTFSWDPGSSHIIATTSPQNGATGVRYVWTSWTGGGAISHTVTPTTNKTYTANFNTQYFLTTSHGTGGTVTPGSAWKNSGAVVSIHATPASGYSFTNWTGSGTGSFTGTSNPASITMGGPITETATFTHN